MTARSSSGTVELTRGVQVDGKSDEKDAVSDVINSASSEIQLSIIIRPEKIVGQRVKLQPTARSFYSPLLNDVHGIIQRTNCRHFFVHWFKVPTLDDFYPSAHIYALMPNQYMQSDEN